MLQWRLLSVDRMACADRSLLQMVTGLAAHGASSDGLLHSSAGSERLSDMQQHPSLCLQSSGHHQHNRGGLHWQEETLASQQ